MNPKANSALTTKQPSVNAGITSQNKKVRLKTIDLVPVKEAISNQGLSFIQGDDPRNPGEKVIFSAAPVFDNSELSGYVYIVLQSEEYERATNAVFGSYVIRIGTMGFVITLITTFFFGLLIIYFLTKSLRKIQLGVQEFENGNLHARIEVKSQDEMGRLAMSINSMSDTILNNIEELKQIDGLRRELIANVSHDLRSPMAVIHGYVETYMMKKDALSEEEHEQYLHAILHNTERLNKLVNDLFELSKLEAKQVALHKEPLMINELLEEICSQFSMLAKKNQIELIAEIPRKMNPIIADAHLIGRAIQNLLDNALKYTQPNGSVKLTTAMLGEKLEIVLTNTGAGILAEDIPHVFDRYYKANNTASSQSTGLGLAITKKIIDLHFGEILVMSIPGQQTRFSVLLPISHQE